MPRLVFILALLAATAPLDSAQLTIVRGRVVAQDDAAAPMRGARVVLVSDSAKAEPVFTDGEGRFTLGVPAGYTLRITKAGYAPAVVVGKSAAAGEIAVRLSRGAVITGRVIDAPGFPVVGAGVRARRLDPSAEQRAAGLTEFTGETDDAGEFRLGSLPPGRYALHSEPRMPFRDLAHMLVSETDLPHVQAMAKSLRAPWAMSDDVTVDARAGDETVAMLRHRQAAVASADASIGGAVTGIVVDEFGEPLDGVTVRAWQLRYVDGRRVAVPSGATHRTDDRGQYRLFHVPPGQYLIGVDDDDGPWTTVFHPQTARPADARAVTVAATQDTPGTHVAFTRTRNARLIGMARTSNGAPLTGTVMLTASRRSGALAMPRLDLTATDGAFEFLNVPPGEYVLRAVPGNGGRVDEVGVQAVTVTGADVQPIAITSAPTATIAGRVVTESGEAPGPDLYFSIVAVPDPDHSPSGARRPPVVLRDDRTFEISGLAGPTRFAMIDGPSGWILKSVDIRGVNAAEDPVVFGPDDSRRDVVVTVSDGGGRLSGRLQDDAGRAVDDFRVVLFSTMRERWFGGSPYVQMTGGPDADGGYYFSSIRPGEYFVVAVDRLDGDGASGEWQTVEFLESFAGVARRVAIGERQQATADLRLIRR